MGCQTDSDGRPGLPSELCQSGSPTDGTALPFVFECFSLPMAPHPPPPSTPYRLNPRYYSRQKKPPQKPGAFKWLVVLAMKY